MPAAFCGISGMKQTYGIVPKSGCLPLGVTLDHIGPMARSAADCAAMLEVMAGFDPSDPSMLPGVAAGGYVAGLSGDLTGVTVGVDRASHLGHEGEGPAVGPAFEAAVAALVAAGATVVDVALPLYTEVTTACIYTMCAEAFAFHRPNLSGRWPDFGRGMRGFVGQGALLTAADYAQVLKVRRIGKAALDEVFTSVDLVVSPTTAVGATRHDELTWEALMGAIFTPYWDSVGCPALAVPMGFTAGGLPLSLQIGGRALEDGLVLRAGDAFQRLTDHHLQVPALSTPQPA